MTEVTEAFSTALDHFRLGRYAQAEQICQQIVVAQPEFAEAWNLLSLTAHHVGNFQLAADCAQRYFELAPNSPEANTNFGVLLTHQKRFEEAIIRHQRAIELQPNFAQAHFNLGNTYRQAFRLNEAEATYRRAVELQPDYSKALCNLGITLVEQDRPDDAVTYYHQALHWKPDYAEAYHNLGNAFMDQAKYAEAAHYYQRAIALAPNLADAHFGLSNLFLREGNLTEGWPKYEWRWITSDAGSERVFQQFRWDGSPLAGKTILIHAEQGFGDTLQFVRYAALVENLGATVIFECQRQLFQLLRRCAGIGQLCCKGDELPFFDFHIPLLSLPTILKTTLETIPSQVPYVFADPALVAQWREQLAPLAGFRIGINWHGRGGQGFFRKRDLPLEQFVALSAVPGLQLVCLQKEIDAGEAVQLSSCPHIHRPGSDFDTVNGAFMDAAAIMKNLDLVITSDTAIAHLAGALGVPVWVALPFVPDWRWLLDRSDSPWYPTMRLFRQKSPSDWTGVFEEIRYALSMLVV